MNGKNSDQESYRTLQLMTELEGGDAVSQRELANRLGIAVGLVNSCLKHFVAKGYIRVKSFPRNRYAYLLTPQGLAEKSRLAYQHLSYFTHLYTATRREYLQLFYDLKAKGVTGVVFCGVDEVAEIAFLSLQEAGMQLLMVLDDTGDRHALFGYPVLPLEGAELEKGGVAVITSLKRSDQIYAKLIQSSFAHERICRIGASSGIDKNIT